MRALSLFALFLAACAAAGGKASKYVRIETDTGRVYYARRSGITERERLSGIRFEDAVTGRTVVLDAGTYSLRAASRGEIFNLRAERAFYGD